MGEQREEAGRNRLDLIYADGSVQQLECGSWALAWAVAPYWSRVFGVEVVGVRVRGFGV